MGTERRRKRAESEDLTDLAGAIAQLGAEAAHVAVWRLNSGTSKPPAFLGRVPAADFTLDLVAERWGGGDYRARVANASGTWVKGGAFTFAIDGKPKSPDESAAAANGNGAHANGNGSSLAEKLLLATVPALVTVFGGAIAKALTTPREADPILLELLKQRGNGKNDLSPVELLTLFETQRRNTRDETLELMNDREPAKAVPTSWADVVMTTVPELVQVFKREQQDRVVVPRARATVAADAGQNVQHSPQGETVRPPDSAAAAEPAWLRRARKQLPFALMLADKGKDPELQAAVTIDMLDAADVDELAANTASPTFVEDVLAAVPELSSTPARREWFIKYLTAIKDSFEDDEPAVTDVAGDTHAPSSTASVTDA